MSSIFYDVSGYRFIARPESLGVTTEEMAQMETGALPAGRADQLKVLTQAAVSLLESAEPEGCA